MRIIAFSGKKQSGKTTAIDDLGVELDADNTNWHPLNFADGLKELVFRYFATLTEVYKHTMYEPFTSEESKNRVHPCGKTYRELLQIVGTDWCRNIWPDIWVENYKYTAHQICLDYASPVTILTADVRFPNEVKCIQELGGHVIRLLRNPYNDKHESETALNWLDGEYFNPPQTEKAKNLYKDLRFDAFVDNRNMSIEEQNDAVWKLVNERGWI